MTTTKDTAQGSRPAGSACRSRRHDVPGCRPRVAPGLEICAECRDQAEEHLVDLPVLYEMCAYELDLRRPAPRERVSGYRPHGIVLRDTVVAVRADIQGVLTSWCGLVTSERGVLGPDQLSVRQLTRFVAVHLNWLTRHPAAPDLVDELADLFGAAREVLRPPDEQRRVLGPCAHPGCGLMVLAHPGPDNGAADRVSCEAGHVWRPEHWLLLRGRRTADLPRTASPEGAE